MAEAFLRLSKEDRSAILNDAATKIGLAAHVLEKDVWVSWSLQQLFQLKDHTMVFKGGTTLSKVFGVIHRFSEDLDITIDYRSLGLSFDPLEVGLSKSKIEKASEFFRTAVREYVHSRVAPHFESQVASEFGSTVCRIQVNENGEELRVHYPTALDASANGYVPHSVLLEFGGRNITEPNEEREVRPYLSVEESLKTLTFPIAHVPVLSPHRTFWEKATLMHVECMRADARPKYDRYSRHWYDVFMLVEHAIGVEALARREILESVVAHKRVFFRANYDGCLTGSFRLVPKDAILERLRVDFESMRAAGMFVGEPASFQAIVDRLRSLEDDINAVTRS